MQQSSSSPPKKKRSTGIDDERPEVAKRPLPRLTLDILKRDRRTSDYVEVNLRDGRAWIVERSDAPHLTAEVLAEKGQPIQQAAFLFEGELWEIELWHGVPFSLEMEKAALLAAYKSQDLTDPRVLRQRDTEVRRLILSGMIAYPVFSYKGQPEGGYPIEDCSALVIQELWKTYHQLHFPMADDIYQVEVLRGVPEDTFILLGDTFETYNVGGKAIAEMADSEIKTFVQRLDEQRAVLVPSMLLSPKLTTAAAVEDGSESEGYPIEQLSEFMMQVLFNAYKVSNVPKARAEQLRRFPRKVANIVGTESDTGNSGDGGAV